MNTVEDKVRMVRETRRVWSKQKHYRKEQQSNMNWNNEEDPRKEGAIINTTSMGVIILQLT